jgi:hypothetical protein
VPDLMMGLANVWPNVTRAAKPGQPEAEKKPCWICLLIALAVLWALSQGCAANFGSGSVAQDRRAEFSPSLNVTRTNAPPR